MKKGLKTAGFGIAAILSLLVMLALLELNKNTVPGWILALALFAGFLFLHAKIGGGRTGAQKACPVDRMDRALLRRVPPHMASGEARPGGHG